MTTMVYPEKTVKPLLLHTRLCSLWEEMASSLLSGSLWAEATSSSISSCDFRGSALLRAVLDIHTYTQNTVFTEKKSYLQRLWKTVRQMWIFALYGLNWLSYSVCVCVSPKLLGSDCATLRGTGVDPLFKLAGLILALPLRHMLIHLSKKNNKTAF